LAIIEAFAVPHPPILLPGVGRGSQHGAQATLDGFAAMAARVLELAPELLIVSTSHGQLYNDALTVSTGAGAWGDFSAFRSPEERIDLHFDQEFVAALLADVKKTELPIVGRPVPTGKLDHGVLVPLHFIGAEFLASCPVVRIGISFLDERSHYQLGKSVAQVAEALGRRAIYIASGDLSHRLKPDGPYGFNPAGPQFDQAVCAAFASGELDGLMHFDADFRDAAAECGLNSFIIMSGALGALEQPPVEAELLSYEGPWGVGYGIARFVPDGRGELSACSAPQVRGELSAQPTARPVSEHSLPVRLAFAALDDLLAGNRRPNESTPAVAALLAQVAAADDPMLAELQTRQAGAFVSFHLRDLSDAQAEGELRGCIGTIAASCSNLIEEICNNTSSAAMRDPRFPPIDASERPELTCSVDILGETEAIASTAELDVKRYGVIVSSGHRRGLLLPDLEGVDTAFEQVSIAARKGGISLAGDYQLERFEVVRYR
jgi:AmmeMemoRadiSam system protein A